MRCLRGVKLSMIKAIPKIKNFPVIYKFLFLSAFFSVSGVALFTSSLILYKNPVKSLSPQVLSSRSANYSGVQVFASLPSNFPSISGEVLSADARAELIREYLQYYSSPLEPFADSIVSIADKYGVDYRLTTAIAQQESNLCKKIPEGTYNCWGWGIHSEGTLGFASYIDGLETVTRGLKMEYIDKGYTSIEEIMSKYTPLSQGSWAYGVNKFMNQLE